MSRRYLEYRAAYTAVLTSEAGFLVVQTPEDGPLTLRRIELDE
ncbi:MAG: hypothetical protein ACFB51_17850 [Anaerolineae bacterium]